MNPDSRSTQALNTRFNLPVESKDLGLEEAREREENSTEINYSIGDKFFIWLADRTLHYWSNDFEYRSSQGSKCTIRTIFDHFLANTYWTWNITYRTLDPGVTSGISPPSLSPSRT